MTAISLTTLFKPVPGDEVTLENLRRAPYDPMLSTWDVVDTHLPFPAFPLKGGASKHPDKETIARASELAKKINFYNGKEFKKSMKNAVTLLACCKPTWNKRYTVRREQPSIPKAAIQAIFPTWISKLLISQKRKTTPEEEVALFKAALLEITERRSILLTTHPDIDTEYAQKEQTQIKLINAMINGLRTFS